MTYKKGDKKYQTLNALTHDYIAAANNNMRQETVFQHLDDMLCEAVKMDITLEHLLKVLSTSGIAKSDTVPFISNISNRYAYEVDNTKIRSEGV